MINIKSIATATDGSVKRMAVTFDVINESGKVTTANAKLNRVIVDDSVLKAVDTLDLFAQNSVNETLSE